MTHVDVEDLVEELGPHLVAGVDGTDGALRAVRWAATEAEADGSALLLVHAAPYATVPAGSARADRIVGRARTVARRAAPGLVVRTAWVPHAPEAVLRDAGDRARLLAVGAVGDGLPQDTFTDRFGLRLAGRVPCPVAVVHRTVPRRGPVVVGIGDPARDAGLVGVAHGIALRHGTGLRLVHAGRPRDDGVLETLARRWDERSPLVEVVADHAADRPIPVLLAEARDARLVVVGPGTRHGHILVGSTARALIRGAVCPVLVGGAAQRAGSLAGTGPTGDPHRRDDLW